MVFFCAECRAGAGRPDRDRFYNLNATYAVTGETGCVYICPKVS